MVTSAPRSPAAPAPEDLERQRLQYLRLIHVGRRALAMDEETWRDYLKRAFLKASSSELTLPQLKTALKHLRSKGFVPTDKGGQPRPPHEWSFVDTANPHRQPLLRKILMLMQATPVPRGQQVAYVEGIAKQMAGFNADGRPPAAKPLPMCGEVDLRRIVQALAIHIKRWEDRAGRVPADA